MNPKPQLNPFLYGNPVPPNRLIGRRDAARTLFSRLANGESTAIVGEPHIGKSSLLQYIADDDIRREWLNKIPEHHLFVDFDCHLIAADFKPTDFWQQVVAQVRETDTKDALKQQCDFVEKNDFGSFMLEGLFKLLTKQQRRVVLLIDEFDSLLYHTNFNKAEFFGALRSFATRTDALVVIAASRLSVAQMNRKSQEINPYGSPFFNNAIEVRLLPLARDDAQQLIATTLQCAGNAVTFSPDDYAFLFSLSGWHPFLLQVAGASLYDAIADGKTGDVRYAEATKSFHTCASAHFDDLWYRHLAPNEQRALLLLALAQYRGYTDKRAFDLREIGKLDWYAPDLRHLRDLGIVESDAAPGAARWQNENWRIAAGGIVPWLMDNVVSGTRDAKDFGEWLRDKEFQGLLTREEAAKLKEIASKIPKGAIGMAAEFIRSLFKKGV